MTGATGVAEASGILPGRLALGVAIGFAFQRLDRGAVRNAKSVMLRVPKPPSPRKIVKPGRQPPVAASRSAARRSRGFV
jgi:hypothetical protein